MPVHHDLAQRRAARALEPVPAVRAQAARTRRPSRRDGQEHRGSEAQEAVLRDAVVEGAALNLRPSSLTGSFEVAGMLTD